MRTKIIFLFFILLSILLISITLLFEAKHIYLAKVEKIRILNIQKVYYKSYFRKRDKHVPKRSVEFAQKEINQILIENPIEFEKNSSLVKNHQILRGITNILNNLKKEAIVEIKTYTDKDGHKQYNLKLSQQRADELKKYINNRTKMSFISAIGYGEEIQHKKNEKKYLEIYLKRVK